MKERQKATSNAGEREREKIFFFFFWLGLLRLTKTVGRMKFFKGKVVFLLFGEMSMI